MTLTVSQTQATTRGVFAVYWAVYLLALLPIHWPVSSGFELSFLILGVVGVVVLAAAAINARSFRVLAYCGVALTLMLYVAYWESISSTVLSHKPELGLADLISRQGETLCAIVERRLAANAYWGVVNVAFFEAVAPFAQIALGIWLLVTGRGHSPDSLQSNPTAETDARKSGARGSL